MFSRPSDTAFSPEGTSATRNRSRDTSGPPAAHKGRGLARRALAVAAAATLLPLTAVQLRPSPAPAAAAKPAAGGPGSRPLSFEPNAGQDHPAVLFSTRAAGAHVSFTATEVVMALTGQGPGAVRSKTASKAPAAEVSVLRTSFIGANPAPDVVAGTALGGTVN